MTRPNILPLLLLLCLQAWAAPPKRLRMKGNAPAPTAIFEELDQAFEKASADMDPPERVTLQWDDRRAEIDFKDWIAYHANQVELEECLGRVRVVAARGGPRNPLEDVPPWAWAAGGGLLLLLGIPGLLLLRRRKPAILAAAPSTPAAPPPPPLPAPPPAPAPPVARALRFSSGPQAGQRVEIGGPMRLGREAGNEICLGWETGASRIHAQVHPIPEGLALQDLGSANGTFVNGHRIDGPVLLSPGDQLQLGATGLTVEA